jgi:NAD(P)-dependent dehydrogenase (short-subunit alcohol dehydrogenase family)
VTGVTSTAFTDHVAFVTGAGGGMGAAIVAELARHGANVVAVDVKAEPHIQSTHDAGERIHYEQLNVTDEPAVQAALDNVITRFGRLDYVVNAAGVGWFDRDRSIVTSDRNVWDQVLAINLTGAMAVSRFAIPHLLAGGGGAMVHLASVAGLRTADGAMDAYQVSKAGLISLSRGIALTYGPSGLRSNTICPGAILTPMIQPLYDDDPARAVRMVERTPLRRLGTVDDVASAARFLLSGEASFITGTDLVVDGGWTLALA